MTANRPKPATKNAMCQALAGATALTVNQVEDLFDALTGFIMQQVGEDGPGMVILPDLIKIKRVLKEASKARQGRNPQTGASMEIAAKPAHTVVKVLCLKNLQQFVRGFVVLGGDRR